jgi:hypothetical protein
MEQNVKTFWQRPEGLTGKIVLALLAGASLFGAYYFLPLIILIMSNTLHAMFLLGAIGGLTLVAMDKRVHAIVSYGYKGAMRGITKGFVQIDPIAIAKTYIREMIDNRENVKVQLGNLQGKMQELKLIITQNDKDRETNLKLAQRAQSTGANDLVTLKARKAGRLQESNTTLQNLYTKMELVARVLTKIFENTGYLIEDVQDEVSVKEKERNALKASSSAFKSALKIISGDPDKKYMFDTAMETIVADIGVKMGEMEQFMEISGNVMKSIDLQNGILEEEGLKQLDEWIKNGTSSLLGTDKTLLIDRANNPKEVLDISQPLKLETVERKENKYSKLLETNS